MTDEAMEIVRGSGNVFRDLNLPNPELEQLRSILAARIIGVLDETRMSVRRAQEATGTAAADFSRIRRANLGRFTVDRLMGILHRLDQEVTVSVDFHPRHRQVRRLRTFRCDRRENSDRDRLRESPAGSRIVDHRACRIHLARSQGGTPLPTRANCGGSVT